MKNQIIQNTPDEYPGLMVIGGRRVEAAGGQRIETIDPATGIPFADVPAGSAEDVNEAVANSKKAPPWRMAPYSARRAGSNLIKDGRPYSPRCGPLIAYRNNGQRKPLRESQGDIETSAAYF